MTRVRLGDVEFNVVNSNSLNNCTNRNGDVVLNVSLEVGRVIIYHQPNEFTADIHAFVAAEKIGGVKGGFDNKGTTAVCKFCPLNEEGEEEKILDEKDLENGWKIGTITAVL